MEIKDLKQYHKNPRKITKEDFDLLGASLVEFGDLSGIVVNRITGEVIGGNQRTQFFKKNPDAEIHIEETYPKATESGTVATGYVTFSGEKYSYREVEWDLEKEERANIRANKLGGTWDFDMLANAFDNSVLLDSGWKAFEIGFATTRDEETQDKDSLKGSMESYLEGNVKQVTLYFTAEEFEQVMKRIDRIMTQTGAASHTEVFLKLLEAYESH